MDNELLERAVSALELKSVFLGGSNFYLNNELGPDIDEIEFHELYMERPVEITFFHKKVTKDELEESEKNKILRFSYRFGLRLYIESPEEKSDSTEADSEKNPDIEIVTDYNLDYWVDENKDELSDDEIKAFMAHNVPYHAWPYWREYVSDVTGRLGIKPIFMPMKKYK